MSSPERELEALRGIDRLSSHLNRVGTPQHAVRYVLREARELLGAEAGCVAVARDREPGAHILFAIPKGTPWDLELLAQFIRVERPARPDDLAIVPIRRRGEAWAAMAFVRPGRPYDFQPIWFLASPERVGAAAGGSAGHHAHPAIEGPVLEDSTGARVMPGPTGGASDSW